MVNGIIGMSSGQGGRHDSGKQTPFMSANILPIGRKNLPSPTRTGQESSRIRREGSR
jgi:hypothetical protein